MLNRRTFTTRIAAAAIVGGAQALKDDDAMRDILRRRVEVEKRTVGVAVCVVTPDRKPPPAPREIGCTRLVRADPYRSSFLLLCLAKYTGSCSRIGCDAVAKYAFEPPISCAPVQRS